jgi:chromosome segregation ATPase
MKPKGMRDIPTAQSLSSRSILASRAKIVPLLARMEQERARLKRELDMWVDRQQQTEGRLQQVRQSIELLQRTLDELPADEERRDSGTQPRVLRGTQPTADDGRKAKGWQEITLEY